MSRNAYGALEAKLTSIQATLGARSQRVFSMGADLTFMGNAHPGAFWLRSQWLAESGALSRDVRTVDTGRQFLADLDYMARVSRAMTMGPPLGQRMVAMAKHRDDPYYARHAISYFAYCAGEAAAEQDARGYAICSSLVGQIAANAGVNVGPWYQRTAEAA